MASLICSCAGLLVGILGTIPGIVCGHLALSRIRRTPGLEGRGLAKAGLIAGYLLTVFWLVLVVAIVIPAIARGVREAQRLGQTQQFPAERRPSPGRFPPSAPPSAMPSRPQFPGQSQELSGSDRLKLLADLQSPGARYLALTLLARAQPTEPRDEVAKAIIPTLSDPSWATRQFAATALGVWGSSKSVPALITLLDDPQVGVRWAAMAALGQLKGSAAAEPLARRLADRTDSMQAANALQILGAEAEDAVIEQLKTGNAEARQAACRVLRVIGTEKSIKPLTTVVNSSDGVVKALAKASLQVIEARKSK